MNSPYEEAYGLQYDNGDVSLERIPYTYTKTNSDLYHTVISGETIQSIAFKYYGDSGLWYIITDANNIYNPITEIVEGLELLIPNGRQ